MSGPEVSRIQRALTTVGRAAAAGRPRVLRWEDPPPTNVGRPRVRPGSGDEKWAPVAAELRGRPGEWAVIADLADGAGSASALASFINGGRISPFSPPGSFEATSRSGVIYARYVGGEG